MGCHLILLLSYTAGTVLSTLPVDLHLVTILWADHTIFSQIYLPMFFCSVFIEGIQTLKQHFHVFVEVAPS